ncbi:DUF2481 family protein [Listeria fleischmannii]|uniref:Uncharacterized protein n=1 Tax=Listeria fleischmannii FSL S10-1203 TaxID=1265822 RepID=W7DNA1_9LIST|nr:DUF2481 family protein [Listeria fleischmannii]EUJ56433.1 hypothetical protein MCOL2_08961 [Listeria fleischmannii FSL S10-1203]
MSLVAGELISENKKRQFEIIEIITENPNMNLNELLKLQRELKQLMNENTRAKKLEILKYKIASGIWNKDKYGCISIKTIAEMRNAGLDIAFMAKYFGISKSSLNNCIYNDRKAYRKHFNKDLSSKNKQFWLSE